MKVKPFKYQKDGVVSLENPDYFHKEDRTISVKDCDFGIQVAEDGRVWICIDGIAFLHFMPIDSFETLANRLYKACRSNPRKGSN